jgi:hypothetical protein
MRTACDLCLCVPSQSTTRIQEMHITIGHAIRGLLEERLAESLYKIYIFLGTCGMVWDTGNCTRLPRLSQRSPLCIAAGNRSPLPLRSRPADGSAPPVRWSRRHARCAADHCVALPRWPKYTQELRLCRSTGGSDGHCSSGSLTGQWFCCSSQPPRPKPKYTNLAAQWCPDGIPSHDREKGF